MVLVRKVAPLPAPAGVTVERWGGGPGVTAGEARIREVASLLVAAFGVDDDETDAVAAEMHAGLESPAVAITVVREAGRVVAVGKSHTFDGATYLSSIATDPLARGRGHGTLLTSTAVAEAVRAGSRRVHLAVNVENDRAVEMYRRCGLEIVGERAADLLLVS
jgi:ribosomal protein S18 acetylase RimI-like enzyme